MEGNTVGKQGAVEAFTGAEAVREGGGVCAIRTYSMAMFLSDSAEAPTPARAPQIQLDLRSELERFTFPCNSVPRPAPERTIVPHHIQIQILHLHCLSQCPLLLYARPRLAPASPTPTGARLQLRRRSNKY